MPTQPKLAALRSVSAQMAAEARNGNWDALPPLQAQVDQIVTDIQRAGGVKAAGAGSTAADDLRCVLDDFAVVEEYVAPWLQQVKPMLDAFAAAAVKG